MIGIAPLRSLRRLIIGGIILMLLTIAGVAYAAWLLNAGWPHAVRVRGVEVALIIAGVVTPMVYGLAGYMLWRYHRLAETVRWLADHDELTGLSNRRAFLTQCAAMWDGDPRDTMLAMIDVDRFKDVNDTHGHVAGDAALRHIARTLRHHTHPSCVIARIGGEEFVMLLPWPIGIAPPPETQQEAAACLEMIRQHIAAHPVPDTGTAPFHVTVSIGLAKSREQETLTALLTRADRALYQAKDAGRNRVMVAV